MSLRNRVRENGEIGASGNQRMDGQKQRTSLRYKVLFVFAMGCRTKGERKGTAADSGGGGGSSSRDGGSGGDGDGGGSSGL